MIESLEAFVCVEGGGERGVGAVFIGLGKGHRPMAF